MIIVQNILQEAVSAMSLIRANLPEALYIVGIFWIIHIVNALLGYRLNVLGIYPRNIFGFFGIPFFSFLHADFAHIFLNSIPLVVFIDLILLGGLEKLVCVSVSIIVISGISIWLFSRRAIHVGASCLLMGYWGYLLVSVYQYPSVMTAIVMLLSLYYFGGLVVNLFPTEERVSWEGHVFGFLAGIATLYICPFSAIILS